MGNLLCSPQQSFILQTDDFEATCHERLDQIILQLIQAKKLLQDIGIIELQVFVDLAFILAEENDIDVDWVVCFHDAVQGYESLLYKLDKKASFS
ncbi:Hypothetical predicted protein [Marmota monax]|uniref:Uncharacterized protein n=1 Tax=Marmota monax TaxID=9995 RepID=A0A5E4D0U8_MARMO|nr:Hypothetical predicted protein [Marmota monax]